MATVCALSLSAIAHAEPVESALDEQDSQDLADSTRTYEQVFFGVEVIRFRPEISLDNSMPILGEMTRFSIEGLRDGWGVGFGAFEAETPWGLGTGGVLRLAAARGDIDWDNPDGGVPLKPGDTELTQLDLIANVAYIFPTPSVTPVLFGGIGGGVSWLGLTLDNDQRVHPYSFDAFLDYGMEVNLYQTRGRQRENYGLAVGWRGYHPMTTPDYHVIENSLGEELTLRLSTGRSSDVYLRVVFGPAFLD